MEIKITNPNKIMFSKDNITKMDLVNYYMDIAPTMLPFVKDRLLSVIRCHEGAGEKCFFKKHPTNDKHIHIKNLNGEEYFYIKNELELVNQVQLGTVEFHTWGSLVQHNEKPDVMVFDLDPDENLSLKKLRDAVLKIKSILDELNLPSFLKTSGGKGYHVVVRVEDKKWQEFSMLSQQIAEYAQAKWPELFTTNIRKVERKGKIFVDYLRNKRAATCVAPYSVRARDHATISLPIAWEDLYNITPNEVTIKNYKKYLNNSWDNFFETDSKTI